MEMPVAEHQPVAATVAARLTRLEEGAEGGDAGAGADQDQRRVAVLGQMEARVLGEIDRQLVAGLEPAGEITRGAAEMPAAVRPVLQGRDRQMDLVLVGCLARGDREQTRLQRAKHFGQAGGVEASRKFGPGWACSRSMNWRSAA